MLSKKQRLSTEKFDSLFLLFVVFASVARVVLQYGVGYVTVRYDLNGAVVVAQLLLGENIRVVTMCCAINADDTLHNAGDCAQIVRNNHHSHIMA